MSMPKGHKSENGYATVTSIEGAKDYRTIANQMTDEGHKMNHATARNVFLRAMKKIAEPLHTRQSKRGFFRPNNSNRGGAF